jgi:hypothetical protein
LRLPHSFPSRGYRKKDSGNGKYEGDVTRLSLHDGLLTAKGFAVEKQNNNCPKRSQGYVYINEATLARIKRGFSSPLQDGLVELSETGYVFSFFFVSSQPLILSLMVSP